MTGAEADDSGRTVFRPDIEGLRAVAVVLVVAFHAGVPGIGGGFVGVDVFFVISGFLVTGILFDELQRTGGISLRSFYARRVRRLLPLAAFVLVAVAVAMQFFTAPVFRPTVRFDALSAALYYSNWQFALESVNYLTLGSAQNPVLHYWSLSVEEQFYLAWPVLLVLAAWLGRGRGPGLATRCAVLCALVGGASLVYSLRATPAEPAMAYFQTTTRLWEFAAGGAVALAIPALLRAPRLVSSPAAVVGLGAVAAAVVAYGPTTEFPGRAALLPVGGAALLLAAGPATAVGRLLSLPPFRVVGRLSYAWYLWHWPCLVFARTARWAPADGRIGWLATSGAVAISFVLACVTHALVEDPARRARWLAVDRRRVAVFGSLTTATTLVALAIAGGPLVVPGQAVASTRSPYPSAATPLAASSSTAYGAMRGCHVGYSADAPGTGCAFGDVHARRTVVLIGDSHAAQWFPAFEVLARREHFRLIAWTKSGCPFTSATSIYLPAIGRSYGECRDWAASVLQRLAALPRPALVIEARTSTYLPQVLDSDGEPIGGAEAARRWGQGFGGGVSALRRLADRVVVLRDTPHAPFDVPACVSWNSSEPAACDFARPKHSDQTEYAAELAAGVPASLYVDPAPAACGPHECRAVVDGVITYRDDNHLTAAYAALLWNRLARALNPSGRVF
jgi:peptidoglycan/LPS O-acetylase OafA/YrhL